MGAFTRTGSPPARAQRGFTYLGLLFFVAITAAALAALGQMWSTAAQREREAELEFRGNEIARAIRSYVLASQGLAGQAAAQPGLPQGMAPAAALGQHYPRTLEDLLVDARGPKPRHHLRRAYPDPFTGEADWVLVPVPGAPGRFNGVHSRSEAALLRVATPDGQALAKAEEWVFSSQPPALGASSPAAAPGGPASAASSPR